PASDQPSERSDPVQKNATTTIGRKAEGAASDQPSETSDPVLKKAKITVAAKMENPVSIEFVDIKRAMDKNTFGQPFETPTAPARIRTDRIPRQKSCADILQMSAKCQ
ncbi:MAG: hypothetical protein WCC50_10895, partial [Pseudolabrys sp.]